MGGLRTALTIGVQALDVSEAALDTTSNNIANADTPGYTDETVDISANPTTLSGGDIVGGGATLDQVNSSRDELLNQQIQQQTSLEGSANTESAALQQVQTYFGNTGTDIASQLASLSSSLAALSASPSSESAQQSVLAAGQSLAQAFNTTAAGLTGAQSQADGQVTSSVSQINSLTQQIAQLNGELAQATASGQNGGVLEDQRDQVVQQLSSLVGVSVSQSSQGEVITTANGTPLVMGSQSFSLQSVTGSNGFQQVEDANGNNITGDLQGGQLGGAIQVRDQTIPGYLSQLNTLATQFAGSFNDAQALGTDSNGNAGQPFFSLPASGQDAAAGISVALTSPSQIAISSDGSAGSNGNVANLSAVLTSPLPSGQTPANAYAGLVFQVGNDASSAGTESTAIGQNLLQLTNQQGSVSAVNIDEETANLIRYQTAYEAGARIVSTIQQLSTDTLDMGSNQDY
ncbi:MAG TPA: flagellar hook-associated protein FlgK [Acidobacteriaceae bacterium]|nr:flagellar hook-associated protein FlgK [Acidobacteriaceae bacterium]